MASRKSFLSKASISSSYMFESTTHHQGQPDAIFDFDEADLWNTMSTTTATNNSSSSSGLKRGSSNKKVVHHHRDDVATSLPVNIPDWSKILKQEYKEHRKWNKSDDDDDDEEDSEDDDYNNTRVPPHEYLAKTRGASLSVHEGIGRTLKGRDLRSVRNAIWKKVGFED